MDSRPWVPAQRPHPWPSRPRSSRRSLPIVIALLCLAATLGAVTLLLWVLAPAQSQGAHPQLGLFAGGDDPSAVLKLAAKLDVKPEIATVYAFGPDYTTYTDPATNLRLLLGVGAVTPAEARTIGSNLVSTGHANTIIRIMWEMNGDSFPWGTQNLSAAEYIQIFRRAERAFASVPGNHFEYVWNVNAGTQAPGRTEFDTYPGNAYVSNIGIDYYNQNRSIGQGSPASSIAPILAFAASHHRPTSIDEWGVDGLDDPSYVNFVSSIVHNPSNHVAFQAYFSYFNSTITKFPEAEAAYRRDFGPVSPHDSA